MTANFSPTDQKLLDYLKQKARFTASDCIMAGAQRAKRPKPDLTESWVNASDDEGDASDNSGKSLDISDSDCQVENELTPYEANVVDDLMEGADSRRRSSRIARVAEEPENTIKPMTPSPSARRRSARGGPWNFHRLWNSNRFRILGSPTGRFITTWFGSVFGL
jgi:hypothetical protein